MTQPNDYEYCKSLIAQASRKRQFEFIGLEDELMARDWEGLKHLYEGENMFEEIKQEPITVRGSMAILGVIVLKGAYRLMAVALIVVGLVKLFTL